MNIELFRNRIRTSIADQDLQIALDGNSSRRKIGRLEAFSSIPDLPERRSRAHEIKADVIAHLDGYLNLFIDKATANGIIVHRAIDGQEAIRIFLRIAKANNAHLIAKSKSMLSEEINFNHALGKEGIQVVETDLGEFIVQLRGERPSHILTPAVHLRRGQVGQLFHDELGTSYTENIQEMVAIARRVLRKIFLDADIGVSGVNFGVAETGTLCLVTNEGNGRMVTSIPHIHVALMGIERLIPNLDDLALFLSLLPRSGTGQKLSVYTSLIHSPKRTTDVDGPNERHLILVDNGRSAMSASPLAESLYCIRCGACLNACPVFREIGGHAYVGRDGSIAPYPGPIGSVLSPGMLSCENFSQLAQASTLCGACREACPVDINLPDLLLRVRAGGTKASINNRRKSEGVALPGILKLALKGFRLTAVNPFLFSLGQRLGGLISRVYSPGKPYMHIPTWTGWGYSKDFPRFSVSPFRTHWRSINQSVEITNLSSVWSDRPYIPKSPNNHSIVDQFSDELVALGGSFDCLPEPEVTSRLAELLRDRGIDRVCVDAVGKKYIPAIPFILGSDPEIRVGVTGALAGIAETGSLVLIGGESLPLIVSLLPDLHIVILKASDLVPTLTDALRLPEIRISPAAVIITGPSRTADIEMTLTLGVHGPKELHVLLVENN